MKKYLMFSCAGALMLACQVMAQTMVSECVEVVCDGTDPECVPVTCPPCVPVYCPDCEGLSCNPTTIELGCFDRECNPCEEKTCGGSGNYQQTQGFGLSGIDQKGGRGKATGVDLGSSSGSGLAGVGSGDATGMGSETGIDAGTTGTGTDTGTGTGIPGGTNIGGQKTVGSPSNIKNSNKGFHSSNIESGSIDILSGEAEIIDVDSYTILRPSWADAVDEALKIHNYANYIALQIYRLNSYHTSLYNQALEKDRKEKFRECAIDSLKPYFENPTSTWDNYVKAIEAEEPTVLTQPDGQALSDDNLLNETLLQQRDTGFMSDLEIVLDEEKEETKGLGKWTLGHQKLTDLYEEQEKYGVKKKKEVKTFEEEETDPQKEQYQDAGLDTSDEVLWECLDPEGYEKFENEAYEYQEKLKVYKELKAAYEVVNSGYRQIKKTYDELNQLYQELMQCLPSSSVGPFSVGIGGKTSLSVQQCKQCNSNKEKYDRVLQEYNRLLATYAEQRQNYEASLDNYKNSVGQNKPKDYDWFATYVSSNAFGLTAWNEQRTTSTRTQSESCQLTFNSVQKIDSLPELPAAPEEPKKPQKNPPKDYRPSIPPTNDQQYVYREFVWDPKYDELKKHFGKPKLKSSDGTLYIQPMHAGALMWNDQVEKKTWRNLKSVHYYDHDLMYDGGCLEKLHKNYLDYYSLITEKAYDDKDEKFKAPNEIPEPLPPTPEDMLIYVHDDQTVSVYPKKPYPWDDMIDDGKINQYGEMVNYVELDGTKLKNKPADLFEETNRGKEHLDLEQKQIDIEKEVKENEDNLKKLVDEVNAFTSENGLETISDMDFFTKEGFLRVIENLMEQRNQKMSTVPQDLSNEDNMAYVSLVNALRTDTRGDAYISDIISGSIESVISTSPAVTFVENYPGADVYEKVDNYRVYYNDHCLPYLTMLWNLE